MPTVVLADTMAPESPDGHVVGWLPALWSARTPGVVCTCGQDAARCPFWSEVVERAFAGEGLPAENLRALEAELLGRRAAAQSGKRIADRSVREALLGYGASHRALYTAVLDATRSDAVVDLDPELRRAVTLSYDTSIDVQVTLTATVRPEIRGALRRRRVPVHDQRSPAGRPSSGGLPADSHLLLPPEDRP
jgi:hypothetical protein